MPTKKTANASAAKGRSRKPAVPSGLEPIGALVPPFIHGPVSDPAPPFRSFPPSWRNVSLLDFLDTTALNPQHQAMITKLHEGQLARAVESCDKSLAAAKEEYDTLAKVAKQEWKWRPRPPLWPPDWTVDPAPELKPVDVLEYIHDLKVAELTRTKKFLETRIKALRGQ